MIPMIEAMMIPGGPKPGGPYSHVVRAGDFLFVSGQIPRNPDTQEFEFTGIERQTTLVLENIRRILEGCGASPADVVRCNVFLSDPSDFNAMNEVYSAFFGGHKPARTTVGVSFVRPEMKIEIDCIAYRPQA
jgi:2-iminobutanoate/2-iminopropanoate deaminase